MSGPQLRFLIKDFAINFISSYVLFQAIRPIAKHFTKHFSRFENNKKWGKFIVKLFFRKRNLLFDILMNIWERANLWVANERRIKHFYSIQESKIWDKERDRESEIENKWERKTLYQTNYYSMCLQQEELLKSLPQ